MTHYTVRCGDSLWGVAERCYGDGWYWPFLADANPLARAGVAVGIDGVFLEVHDQPERALSDGANALRLDRLKSLWARLREIDGLVKNWP